MLLLYSLDLTPFWLAFKFGLTFYDVPMFHLKYIKSWDRNSARLHHTLKSIKCVRIWVLEKTNFVPRSFFNDWALGSGRLKNYLFSKSKMLSLHQALASLHIWRLMFQFVHCCSFRVQWRPCVDEMNDNVCWSKLLISNYNMVLS